MIKKISKLLFLAFFLLGLKMGDLIELTDSLNARASANFYGHKNVQATIEKGSEGEILKVIKLPSGNFGIQAKILNGDFKGEIFWLYYNVKKPALILKTKRNSKTENPSDATKMKAIEKQLVLKDQSVKIALALSTSVAQGNAQEISKKSDCPEKDIIPTTLPLAPQKTFDASREYETSGIDLLARTAKSNFSEEILTPPFKNTNELPLLPSGCMSRPKGKGWDVCVVKKSDKTEEMTSFKFSNYGPNSIVKNPVAGQSYVSRSFEFEFEDQSRAGIQIFVIDSTNGFTSTTTYNQYLFFPRKYLPAIQRVNDELHVTLPTGEKVIYDAETKQIKSGVLSENVLEELPARAGCDVRNKPCGRAAKPDPLTYSGEGVVMKLSASGNLPSGTKGMATLKKGDKTCRLPIADYWVSKNDNFVFNPKYATDSAFDEVLKKKCGFSMF